MHGYILLCMCGPTYMYIWVYILLCMCGSTSCYGCVVLYLSIYIYIYIFIYHCKFWLYVLLTFWKFLFIAIHCVPSTIFKFSTNSIHVTMTRCLWANKSNYVVKIQFHANRNIMTELGKCTNTKFHTPWMAKSILMDMITFVSIMRLIWLLFSMISFCFFM